MVVGPLQGAHRDNMRAVLKDFYIPEVRNQINENVMLWSRLEPDSEVVSGKQCIVALRTRRHEGHGATRVGSTTLPSPHRQGYIQSSFQWATYYARIQVDGTLSAADKESAGAFLDVFNAEVQELAPDVRSEYNRGAHMDGSGIIGRVVAISATHITARHPLDIPNQGEFLQYIREGMAIMFVDQVNSAGGATTGPKFFAASATAYGSAAQRHWFVGNVDEAAKTFQLFLTEENALSGTGAINPTTDMYDQAGGLSAGGPPVGTAIVRCSYRNSTTATLSTSSYLDYMSYIGAQEARSSSPFLGLSGRIPVEMMGLAGIVSNADLINGYNAGVALTAGLQNLPAGTNSIWRSNVLGNGGVKRNLTQNLMQRAIDHAEIRGNGMISIIVADYGSRRALQNILMANQRYDGEGVLNLRGGYKAISFDGYPVVKDIDAAPGRMYFLDEARLGIALARDFHWLEDDSGGIVTRLRNNNEWEATLAHFGEVWTDRRNSHSVITDITIG